MQPSSSSRSVAADGLAAHLADLLRAGRRLLLLHSHEEQRARSLVGAAAQALGRRMLVYSAASGFAQPPSGVTKTDAGEYPEPWRTLLALDAATPTVVLLLDAHLLIAADPLFGRRLKDSKDLLERTDSAVVCLTPVLSLPPELTHELPVVDLPLPTHAELRELLAALTADHGWTLSKEDVSVCAETARGLTMDETARGAHLAATTTAMRADDLRATLLTEKRQVLRQARGVEVVDTTEDLAAVGGMGELKRWLARRQDAFSVKARDYGLPSPRGLLLLGVQGCGKSMMAKAIASAWRFPLLKLDVGGLFVSSLPPDELLRRALATAEAAAPVALWMDEIEKGFAGGSGGDAMTTRLLGFFLTWLQEHQAPVFTVATANAIDLLPPELVRRGRFDELFFVDLPNESERLEILELHLRRRNRNPADFDLRATAPHCRNFSGAELEQVVVAALYRAFSDGRELTSDDLRREAELLVPLYRVQEEAIKSLREWAEKRTRPAASDASMIRYFRPS